MKSAGKSLQFMKCSTKTNINALLIFRNMELARWRRNKFLTQIKIQTEKVSNVKIIVQNKIQIFLPSISVIFNTNEQTFHQKKSH